MARVKTTPGQKRPTFSWRQAKGRRKRATQAGTDSATACTSAAPIARQRRSAITRKAPKSKKKTQASDDDRALGQRPLGALNPRNQNLCWLNAILQLMVRLPGVRELVDEHLVDVDDAVVQGVLEFSSNIANNVTPCNVKLAAAMTAGIIPSATTPMDPSLLWPKLLQYLDKFVRKPHSFSGLLETAIESDMFCSCCHRSLYATPVTTNSVILFAFMDAPGMRIESENNTMTTGDLYRSAIQGYQHGQQWCEGCQSLSSFHRRPRTVSHGPNLSLRVKIVGDLIANVHLDVVDTIDDPTDPSREWRIVGYMLKHPEPKKTKRKRPAHYSVVVREGDNWWHIGDNEVVAFVPSSDCSLGQVKIQHLQPPQVYMAFYASCPVEK